MAMKKLAPEIQSLFCATQICNYKSAIEELVYNSLDAEATSIAIRVNIDENSLQVIDNGFGITKNDFQLLGQKYATSKGVDISTLKSVPNKYGFRGQSLASIIEVSKRLTITSRCADSEETWTKEFYKSKECRVEEVTVRPSKGTTVEIKGFLHNLHIQKKSINSLTELSAIKTYLKQLSLVHNKTSISMRDDSRNEIVFKLRKNRDIYQTLSTVFGVEKHDVQELKVEKNEYKITAIIANRDMDISQYHWVYLNGKFVNSSNIYKVINGYLIKLLGFKNTKKRIKTRNNLPEQEDITSKKMIPMYFVFITCPYCDYDISLKSKSSTLEFKNWEHIKKLIEKFVKFYMGDIHLNEVTAIKVTESKVNKSEDDTREKVKKIMERILRSCSKKPRVSQMQNGVKGKIIKRTSKKNIAKLPVTNLIGTEKSTEHVSNDFTNHRDLPVADRNNYDKNILSTTNGETANKKKDVTVKRDIKHKEDNFKNLKSTKILEKAKALQNIGIGNRSKKSNIQKPRNKAMYAIQNKKDRLNNTLKQNIIKSKKMLQKNKNLLGEKKIKTHEDPILNKFKKGSDSVKQRCNILTKSVENLMSYQKKRKRKIFVNETVHYSTVVKDNKNVSVHRKVDEIVIQDFIPLPPRFDPCSIDDRVWKKLPEKSCKTSYDLIQTIIKSQKDCTKSYTNERDAVSRRFNNYDKQIDTTCNNGLIYETDDFQNCEISNQNYYQSLSDNVIKFTYDSHHHRVTKSYNNKDNRQDSKNSNNCLELTETKNRNKHFITKQSRDNFTVPNLYKYKNRLNKYVSGIKRLHKLKNPIFSYLKDTHNNNFCPPEDSFSIDYIESNFCENSIGDSGRHNNFYINSPQNKEFEIMQSKTICGGTYTIISNTSHTSHRDVDCEFQQNMNISVARSQKTYCTHTSKDSRINRSEGNANLIDMEKRNEELVIRDTESAKKDFTNVVFESNSQNNILNESEIEPINICEITMKCNQDEQKGDSGIRKLNFNNSLFNYDFSIDSALFDREAYSNMKHTKNIQTKNENSIYSQYFGEKKNNLQAAEKLLLKTTQITDAVENNHKKKIEIDEHFNFKTRSRFVPKGLSPIFVNCQTTKICDYNLEKDYYEDTIYNQFATDVQVQSDIFEPNIQHVKELKTKDIARVNERINKNNASLVFDGASLEQAIVLRQVDSKFIAVKVKGKCYQSADVSEYLVLFDQHAVHERIRLEKNLAEYFVEDNWTSVSLDAMLIKLTKEEIIYLHNYSDKFTQLGLKWSVVSDEELTITSIPEAILGKNPRQVDVVIKAVRNLISEEVQAIKTQKGCISLYPKSIMDLVFSEACRYAIKFGDKLSTHECTDLLKSLSKCKTPFQCAHGRPVMAVLMNIKSDTHKLNYKIVTSKLHQFINSLK